MKLQIDKDKLASMFSKLTEELKHRELSAKYILEYPNRFGFGRTTKVSKLLIKYLKHDWSTYIYNTERYKYRLKDCPYNSSMMAVEYIKFIKDYGSKHNLPTEEIEVSKSSDELKIDSKVYFMCNDSIVEGTILGMSKVDLDSDLQYFIWNPVTKQRDVMDISQFFKNKTDLVNNLLNNIAKDK